VRWPRYREPRTQQPPLYRTGAAALEQTAPNSRFGATRDVGKQLSRVRRELARIATALWLIAFTALLALFTWLAQLMAATR
jgi:hypothetical protein